MRFLIAGSSGFLGSALVDHLREHGHQVTRLVRGAAKAPDEAVWNPYRGELDPTLIEATDVVVNLAGSPTAGNPHSATWARELKESRVTTTDVLARAIAASQRRPVFLAGNGISYYGDQGATPLTEAAPSTGEAYLTEVTRVWEAAAEPAIAAGSRVVILRTAPVLDAANAPLKQLKLLFKAGLGGPLGKGDQYFPVISLRDWVAAVRHCAEAESVRGPVNLCCPVTPTNAEFTKALAAAVHRPAFFRVPAGVLKVTAGKMAPEVLGSMRGVPQALLDSGFTFADADIIAVVNTGLAQRR